MIISEIKLSITSPKPLTIRSSTRFLVPHDERLRAKLSLGIESVVRDWPFPPGDKAPLSFGRDTLGIIPESAVYSTRNRGRIALRELSVSGIWGSMLVGTIEWVYAFSCTDSVDGC